MPIKKITFVVIPFFVLIGWYYSQTNNFDQKSHEPANADSATDKIPSREGMNSNSQNLPSAKVNTSNSATSNQPTQLEAKNLPDNEPLNRYLSATQNAQSLAEKIKSDPTLNLSKAAQSTFDKEPYQQAWAEPRRIGLQNSFHNTQELQNLNLKSVECKSKFCQIQIFYKDKSELEPVVQQLAMSSISGNLKGLFSPSAQIVYSEDGMTGIIYLSDDINAKLEP